MIVCIFRSRTRPDADLDALAALDHELDALVRTIPGFVSNKGFSAPDGEGVGIIEFASLEAFETWRTHPAHLAAKERGREDFFARFSVQVCAPFHVAGRP
jgi:heme-degrading monooxygenase HmoA